MWEGDGRAWEGGGGHGFRGTAPSYVEAFSTPKSDAGGDPREGTDGAFSHGFHMADGTQACCPESGEGTR